MLCQIASDSVTLCGAQKSRFGSMGHGATGPSSRGHESVEGFSTSIDINPALFPRSLFTYSALLLLGFLFTTVELWSLACCLEEFPSNAIVYFKANYFEIG